MYNDSVIKPIKLGIEYIVIKSINDIPKDSQFNESIILNIK